MFNFFSKLVFLFKKPRLVIVAGKGRDLAMEAIFQVLKHRFRAEKIQKIGFLKILKNSVLIINSELGEDLNFFIENSEKPLLIVTHIGEIPPDVYFFAGEKKEAKEIIKIVRLIPLSGTLLLNFDDETVREMEDRAQIDSLTFGFQGRADLIASDFHTNEIATNFKINYQGSVVPVWIENLFGKENVYSALAATGCAIKFGLNLVEISQALRNFKGLDGKMKLISGINGSRILDDSESAFVYSMLSALKILAEIASRGRKIAVLGDILGIERYPVQSHQSIGKEVARVADLLFIVGPRAKFFAQGARENGLAKEKIFSFDTIEETIKFLKKEIKKGDLILVDGSKEMKMRKIVAEIKAI